MRVRLSRRSPDGFSSSGRTRRLAGLSLRDRDPLRRRSISQPPETLLRLRATTISRTPRRTTRLLRVECLSSEEECLQLRLRSMTVRRIAISPPDLPLAIAIRTTTTPTMAHRTWTTRVVLFRRPNMETMPARLSGVISAFSSSKVRRATDPSLRDRDQLRRRSISQPTMIPLRLRATTISRTRRMTRLLQSEVLVSNGQCLHLRLRPTTIPRTATRTPSLPLLTAIRTSIIQTPARRIWAAVRLVRFRLRELERLALQEWADRR